MSVNFLHITACFRCEGNDVVLDYKAGDVICRDCGEVINDRVIDEGNEVKFYMNDDDPSKTSRSSGLAETIGSLQTSFVTNSDTVKRTLERAQRFSSDRKELQALSHMNAVSEMCSKMNLILPIKNKAIEVFTNTILGRVVVSKSKEPIIAACVYLACRIENYPRTLDEVNFATGVDVKLIGRMQREIAHKLQLKINRLLPQHLVNRFATRVFCSHPVSVLAQEICQNLSKHNQLESVAPQIVAAGSLVAAALLEGQALDVTLLTQVALVSLSLVKNVYKELHPMLGMMTQRAAGSAAERTRLLARVKALPATLASLIKEGQLAVVKHADSPAVVEKTAPVSTTTTTTTPAKVSPSAAVGDDLALLVNELTAPVPVPVAHRVSSNNLSALLQSQRENMPSPQSTAAANCASPSSSTGAKLELSVSETVGSKRPASTVSCEEHTNDLEMLEPDRKVRKLASAKGE